eukprot:16835-Eustigmatos_ZCMA.PRE.1
MASVLACISANVLVHMNRIMSAEDQKAVQAPGGARESREDFVQLNQRSESSSLCERGSFNHWCYSYQTPLSGLSAGLGRQCA